MIKTKRVPKELYRNYFLKAQEFYQAMKNAERFLSWVKGNLPL